MSDILNEKVDLSALNLGSFTLSALLGAVVTFCICVIAMRLILSLLRRMLDKTRLDATLRKYALGAVRLVLWVIIALIVADQLGIPVTSLVALLSVVSLAVSLAVQSVLSNIAGGLVIVLFVSGLVEALVTPSPLPTWARIGIGVIALAAYLAYAGILGRRAVLLGETGDLTAQQAGDYRPTEG